MIYDLWTSFSAANFKLLNLFLSPCNHDIALLNWLFFGKYFMKLTTEIWINYLYTEKREEMGKFIVWKTKEIKYLILFPKEMTEFQKSETIWNICYSQGCRAVICRLTPALVRKRLALILVRVEDKRERGFERFFFNALPAPYLV